MRSQPAGQLEMGVGRQAEEDEILFSGDGFEYHGWTTRFRMSFPKAKPVALAQKEFHRPAHFAVAKDEHPERARGCHGDGTRVGSKAGGRMAGFIWLLYCRLIPGVLGARAEERI
jgi:hypothetical protein